MDTLPPIKNKRDAGIWQPARAEERLAFFKRKYELVLRQAWDLVYEHFERVCRSGPCISTRKIRLNAARDWPAFRRLTERHFFKCPPYIQLWVSREICPRIFRYMASEMDTYIENAPDNEPQQPREREINWNRILDPWHESCSSWDSHDKQALFDLPPPVVPMARRLGSRDGLR